MTEGEVYYDGLLTNNVNLDALRSNITIIPQMVSMRVTFKPTLLSYPCSLSFLVEVLDAT